MDIQSSIYGSKNQISDIQNHIEDIYKFNNEYPVTWILDVLKTNYGYIGQLTVIQKPGRGWEAGGCTASLLAILGIHKSIFAYRDILLYGYLTFSFDIQKSNFEYHS